jgi:hypothetical protein
VASDSAGEVLRAFTDAMNRGDHESAALLLADDVELSFPGVELRGRDSWLESRRRQPADEHLAEEVEIETESENGSDVELQGRLVHRWLESGEPAGELPVRIAATVEGGLIVRLVFRLGE